MCIKKDAQKFPKWMPFMQKKLNKCRSASTEQQSQQQKYHHNTHQLGHASHIIEVWKEFNAFDHASRINQSTSATSNERVILPLSTEELNKLLLSSCYMVKVFEYAIQFRNSLQSYVFSINFKLKGWWWE